MAWEDKILKYFPGVEHPSAPRMVDLVDPSHRYRIKVTRKQRALLEIGAMLFWPIFAVILYMLFVG